MNEHYQRHTIKKFLRLVRLSIDAGKLDDAEKVLASIENMGFPFQETFKT